MEFFCNSSTPFLINLEILEVDISIDLSEISQPIKSQLFLIAAIAEDALPKNGSQTVNPFSALAKIIA